jgi:hypothetical protein
MTIYITVEGPVYITMQSGASSPLGGGFGPAMLKESAAMPFETTIDNEHRVIMFIEPTTQGGQPAQTDGDPVWTQEAGTSCTLEDLDPPDPKRRYATADPSIVGDSLFQCMADADLGAGVVHLVQTWLVHVENPQAASLGGGFEAPELKPTA